MEPEDVHKGDPVRLGYYDPFSVYPLIKNDLEAKFPLTNLHWKYHAAKPLKSIPLLPVQLIEEVPKKDVGHTHDVYARFMLVKIQNLDVYRSQVRPLIKEWLKHLVLNNHVEWMILLYVPLTTKDKHSTLIKTSSFDKLKIDFGPEGKELHSLPEFNLQTLGDVQRCFKISEAAEKLETLDTYNELTVTLKKLLLASFDDKYQLLTSSLASSKSVDQHIFLLKLKLANLLNDMKLHLESLSYYNELYKDLMDYTNTDPSKLDYSIGYLPNDLNNFRIESLGSRSNLLVDGKINLFNMKCYIFMRQSVLLQSLGHLSTSVSISAISISSLFQKLLVFLNDMAKSFPDSDLNEFTFAMIDTYLNLPISIKLFEKGHHQETTEPVLQLKEILEFHGELKLFQRSKLVKIAEKRGYTISGFNQIFEEIDLNKDNEVKALKLSYLPIIEATKTEESFFNTFEKLTEQIIQDFVASERPKTIDMLSIDLSLLNYQRKNYQESLNILQDSYDFFILNGWNFMGGILLEIYLDCIEKLQPDNNQLILSTCLKLLSSLVTNKNKVGINNYNLTKSKTQIQNIFDKIIESSSRMDEAMEFPIEGLFEVEVIPFIQPHELSLDKYLIELKISNPFDLRFNFSNIDLEITNQDDLTALLFVTNNVSITSQGYHKVLLSSNAFHSGLFYLNKLNIELHDKLRFLKIFQDYNYDVSVIKNGSPRDSVLQLSQSDVPDLYFYPQIDKVWCEFLNPSTIDLGKTLLVLRIHISSNEIANMQISYNSRTEGVKLENSALELKSLETYLVHDLDIPFTYFSDNKIISMKASLSYDVDGETYRHSINHEIDTALQISVSVQDIFKPDYIYSKFQVGTSNLKSPVRILSNDLSTLNKEYCIYKPKTIIPQLVAFGDQPATFFYKIVPQKDYLISESDTLDLVIDYSNLHDECKLYLENTLLRKLEELKLTKYLFLFKYDVIHKALLNLNNYAINRVTNIKNGKDLLVAVDTLVERHVPTAHERQALTDLFKQLFSSSVQEGDGINSLIKQLKISVPVPLLKYLQVVEFDYNKNSRFLVGEPINVLLRVWTYTRWYNESQPSVALAESSPNGKLSHNRKESFQLTVQNDDNWLISGFKKHSFTVEATSENRTKINMVLIPLNVGKLSLPKVAIRGLSDNKDFSMDFDVKNGLETLLVVPDLESITFSF